MRPADATRTTPRHAPAARDTGTPGSVGERINQELGALGRRAGHAALDAAISGAKAAARNPREFAPAAAASALFAAAEGAAHEPALGWPLIYAVLIVCGYLLHQRDKNSAPRLMRRAYYALAYVAAMIYTTTAAITSPTDPLAIQMLAAGAVATSTGWWARRIRRRATAAAASVPDRDEYADLREEIIDWWAGSAAADKGFAPRSRLLAPPDIDEIAVRLDVQLDGERQSFDDLASLQARKRMAASRGISRAMILPMRWEDQREDRVRLKLFRKYLVQENVPFPGPGIDPVTGCATVGRTDEGNPALVRFWMPGSGTWHEIVAGGSGAGKSRYLDQSLVNERHALDAQGRHLIVSWICDPQEGQSLPDWQGRVDEYARTPLESLALLERAYVEMQARSRFLADLEWVDEQGNERKGLSYYDPAKLAELGVDMPILSITLEECPDILAIPRAKVIVERMLKRARKCGIRLRLVVQVPSIAELGNSFTIRPLLAFMSVVCLRTTEPISAGAFPNLPGDPRQLEEVFPNGEPTFGLGYILGAVKPALFRTFFLDETAAYRWANSGSTAHLDLSLSEAYLAKQKAAQQQAQDEDVEDDVPRNGHAPTAADAPVDTRARALIRRYLEMHPGHVTSGQLVAELGLNNSTVSQALARGVAAGEFCRVTHGVYAALGTDPGMWRDDDALAA